MKVREVKIVKEVMACDISPVAMFLRKSMSMHDKVKIGEK